MLKDEFRCPRCDGTTYGGLPERLCHGAMLKPQPQGTVIVVPCSFRWPVEDDWKYTRTVIVQRTVDDQSREIARSAVLAHWLV